MRKTKRRMDDWTRDYSSVWGRERPLRYVSMGCITGSGGCRTDGLQHWEEGSDSTGRDGLGAGARIHGGWAATTLACGPSSLPPDAQAPLGTWYHAQTTTMVEHVRTGEQGHSGSDNAHPEGEEGLHNGAMPWAPARAMRLGSRVTREGEYTVFARM